MPELRKRGVLRAAELYADACTRLSVFIEGAPDGNSAKWPQSFRDEYDKKLMEVEGSKSLLLFLARKL